MLYLIRNSKKITICKTVFFHNNLFSKGTGLMFSSKIKDEAHIFPFNEEKKVSLTMWFVFFSIDVLYLDKNKKIVEVIEGFKPFTNYFPKKNSMYVVELPLGFIKKHKLKIKDVVFF